LCHDLLRLSLRSGDLWKKIFFFFLPSFLPSIICLIEEEEEEEEEKKFSHLPDYILYIKRKNLGLREAHKDFYTHLFFYIKKNK